MKAFVKEPVVGPLVARFFPSNLIYNRRRVCTDPIDIQLGVVSILVKGYKVISI